MSGAKSVADWLKGEGFDVTLIVDEVQPVTANIIKQVVTALVANPALKHWLCISRVTASA